MSMNTVFKVALAGALSLAALPVCHGQWGSIQKMGPEIHVQVHAEATGEVSISAWSSDGAGKLLPVLAEVVHCKNAAQQDPLETNEIHCPRALSRDGLALEGVIDLAPIARRLSASDVIELWVDHPRLGFESSSLPMQEQGGPLRVIETGRFEAGSAPAPIHFRFGYRPDQLARATLPLLALALALTVLAAILARVGVAGLSRSVVLLGTILWMGTAAQLQTGALVHILLYGNPLAPLAALLVELWPPLVCVAAGIALGSRKQDGRKPAGGFSEVFWGFAVIPLLLTSAVGALPQMMAQDWIAAIPWLITAPLFVLLRRAWIRSNTGASVRPLTEGELKERIAALVARARRPPIKVFISFSVRSQAAMAFTLPGKSIYLTAPLVKSLSKREVDAVAAHELSHFSYPGRGQWMALGLAMVLFETPVSALLLSLPGGLFMALLLLLTILFAALHRARKHEFAADASAAALTGDPRAMISGLARVARSNNIPLEMNAAAEWLSTHPSTGKRIRTLAFAARLGANEVDALCGSDDPGASYELPPPASAGPIFTPAWQKINAGVYGWTALLGASCAGLSVAWLLDQSGWTVAVQLLVGIALGCLLTKGLAATVMASNYARLRRKLEARLGVSGQLVGLAVDSEPRVYGGRRFSDAGLLWFAEGRLCYRSERTTIELNPANVVEVAMLAASPANWLREVPMVRFRRPESGDPESSDIAAFILHPLDWLPAQRRLLKSIERWRATQTSAEPTSIGGLNRIEGRPFPRIRIAALVPALGISAGAALMPAIASVFILHATWGFVGCAVAIAASAQIFMFLPSMLYRPPSPPATDLSN